MNQSFSYITDSDIDVSALSAAVEDARAGALVTFAGIVRNHDHGKSVSSIEYVSHPSAEETMRELVAEFASREDIHAIVAQHRIGTLEIGGIALYVAVSTSHRKEAFEYCHEFVDKVKQSLPIWKKQFFPDGSYEWSLCP
ncbi:molybdenum cofactor biosynthesis protein [Corynebacterium kutscheri]|uniref:Molybdenum cofactor biosynthesis protein n=1 Tax=Corynebacterium kutscheri TaxID=35755 RepID=A0A0F6R1C3_9CORY|nr:molybdenum cofactor biosynthesis protein MoaE [Corynebacterium kutscheri]AKE42242.1 molybdopterin converting factor, large subunit [Corynebacterium kutscheri]VEH05691.1 molybdenum cofactor biosynthesis protein [Corynebacterium kutscheri]VEH10585.1 molybdenum cofactor biosynthesis protein [Corynebacterium kutscheri]VEH81586.1 molybdenum cofactor biosynthesis protein [Corynebacterium kutscheri]